MDVQPDNPTDTRLGRIVRLLSDNATVVISGTRIAEELGTTRSEVWRAVQQLRDLGVQITGHPSTGYQLEAVPDLLLPEILGPMLSGTIFAHHIHHYFRIGSTNTTAMQSAAKGEPEGAVLEDGTILRLAPHLGAAYAALLTAGQSVRASGYGTANELGRAFEVTALGVSGQPLIQLYGGSASSR